jgi:hypothetical protein
LECRALCRILGPRVEEDDDLIGRERRIVHPAPVGRRVEREPVRRRLLREPAHRLAEEADVRLVLLAGEEGEHAERRLGRASTGRVRAARDDEEAECGEQMPPRPPAAAALWGGHEDPK